MTFSGDRARGFRNGAGLSQQALANRVGCSTEAVRKWETGAAVPGDDFQEKLAAEFGVDPAELEATSEDPTVDYVRAVLRNAEPLPDDALDAVATVLRRTGRPRARRAGGAPAA